MTHLVCTGLTHRENCGLINSMPERRTLLVTGEVYHVYNRSVAQQPIFDKKRGQERILNLINFYRFKSNSQRFSHFNRQADREKEKYLKSLYFSQKRVEILAFSIMPNHYHLVVKQVCEAGIVDFIRIIQDGYAKYFNLKNKRSGSLFLSPFKAVCVDTDEQLLRVCRYVHLNELASYLLRSPQELSSYRLNSYSDYIADKPRPFVNTNILMSFFKNKKNFEKFTLGQVDDQEELNQIKHLLLEG